MNIATKQDVSPIRVMLVDDSAVIRSLIARALQQDPQIEIVAKAENGAQAIPLAKSLQPDIIILDIEMPEMDGITALPLLLDATRKSKVIMASTLTLRHAAISMEALARGASDYLTKPSANAPGELDAFYHELMYKVKALAASPVVAAVSAPQIPAATQFKAVPVLRPATTAKIQAVAIASSTGGPQALIALFAALKDRLMHVPIFVTQHMPPAFTTILAQNIEKAVGRPCAEAVEGERVQPGRIYMAPGNYHMVVTRGAATTTLHINQEPQVNYCRPAADPMFSSLSHAYGGSLLAVVLTGMGCDGMEGSRTIVDGGGAVIAQDEASCVVYGMPKAVVDQGLCQAVLPLGSIPDFLIGRCI